MDSESFLQLSKPLEFVVGLIDEVITPKLVHRGYSLAVPRRDQDKVVYIVYATWLPQGWTDPNYDPGLVIGHINLHRTGEETLVTFTDPLMIENLSGLKVEMYLQKHPKLRLSLGKYKRDNLVLNQEMDAYTEDHPDLLVDLEAYLSHDPEIHIDMDRFVQDHPEVLQYLEGYAQDNRETLQYVDRFEAAMDNLFVIYFEHMEMARKTWAEFILLLKIELSSLFPTPNTPEINHHTDDTSETETEIVRSAENPPEPKPWEQIPDHLWDRLALQKWWEGYDRNDIGKAVGVSPAAVTNRISELRHQYLVDIVPTDEQRKKFLREKKQRENS